MDRRNFLKAIALAGAAFSIKETEAMTMLTQKFSGPAAKDKYDLVNWIFYTEFFLEIQNSQVRPGWDLVEKICEFFYTNRTFYCNALQVSGQNSFSEYFNEVMHPLILVHYEDIFKDDPDKDFFATFFADAFRVVITRWLLEGSKISPEEFIKK